MSSEDQAVPMPKPLSVAIPDITDVSGPYCPRRPNLKEILNNTSPAPWTLAAFMAYLSNNHCLETLEFTMDAGRYRKHYQKMMSRASSNGMPPAKDREYVQALWQRLVDAYIRPNGSREVNLPSGVRDPILDLRPSELPPAPEELDSAVAKIYELMEESVLVPFLNSAYPQTARPTIQSCPYATSEESLQGVRHEKHSSYAKRGRVQRNSPPPHSAPACSHYSAPALTNRKSAPSTLTTSLHRARFSVKLSPTTSSPAAANTIESQSGMPDLKQSGSGSGSGPGMTDDGDSTTDSPTYDSPMTPPTSPPNSDGSPKRDSGMWKRLGRLSGMNKVGRKKSQAGLHEDL
ncbi:Regulator of G protein signaling domain [Teratosphaeria destructans]|uniref:Regulator of G protein signaling domain n=1 Tax=Teratosphaeria destructans TaxID=418781 RepID=A0A9W7SHT6_9PEZI|nr:Regulator of G protein signaling domain [Teratosphaeria destructans]